MAHDIYDNPLISRYASREMATLWGDQRKFSTWRQLWVWLAEAEAELGLPVTEEQIAELKSKVDAIDFDAANRYERKLRHDVMAHVHAFKEDCPNAGPIIHLGATSMDIVDNAEVMLIRKGLELIANRLASVILSLAEFAHEFRGMPTLGFTHMQPAQPTTVGRRACLWAYDLALDLKEIEYRSKELRARGLRGATGTQASFLELFEGKKSKVEKLEKLFIQSMGFKRAYVIEGQTYSRKVDAQILESLGGIAASAHKAATDLRLLAHRKEIEEPFEADQIGSSAMAYKRNPMRSERICGLARFAMSLSSNATTTHATQWMERTLDDSANRRLVLPQAFLAVDAVLVLYQNVATGLVVYPQVIARHLREELPFMATENILMAAVAAGGDRQELHELIRQHSQAAAAVVKQQGGENDLIARLKSDRAFDKVDVDAAIDPATLTGRSAEQVDEFLAEIVSPIRARYGNSQTSAAEVRV